MSDYLRLEEVLVKIHEAKAKINMNAVGHTAAKVMQMFNDLEAEIDTLEEIQITGGSCGPNIVW